LRTKYGHVLRISRQKAEQFLGSLDLLAERAGFSLASSHMLLQMKDVRIKAFICFTCFVATVLDFFHSTDCERPFFPSNGMDGMDARFPSRELFRGAEEKSASRDDPTAQ
jgi:hypothetical protein